MNHDHLQNTFFVLMFNKFDLFQMKYFQERIPIKYDNPDDPPPPILSQETNEECPKALEWFESIFMNRVPANKEKHVSLLPVTSQCSSCVAR